MKLTKEQAYRSYNVDKWEDGEDRRETRIRNFHVEKLELEDHEKDV